MASLTGVIIPWDKSNSILDLDYIYRWSGNKSISPLVRHVLGDNSVMPDSGYATLAAVVWTHFGDQWTRAYNALVTEYMPLENYNMVETEVNEITDDSTTDVTGSATNNNTTVSSAKNVYGYNTSTAVPSETESINTGQNTDVKTDYDNTRNIDRELHRSGNIGVTTSQQMLEAELKLRAYRFFERVYKDVDSILALPIYDGEITAAIYQPVSGGGGGGGAVDSVNGKTGNVVIYGTDIDLTEVISTSVAEAISQLNTGKQTKPVVLTGTMTANSTMFMLEDDSIGDNSLIDIYFNRSDVKMTGWSQSGHAFTMFFDPIAYSVGITLEVYN